MPRRLVSGREAVIWTVAFLAVSWVLVATRFSSTDPDSDLYAGLSARLSQQPVARWIAPEWWGLWPRLGGTGLYRDHPVGGFLLPAALGRAGIPAEQAAYIVGVAAGVMALVLIGLLVSRITSRADGRAALVLLQVMPVAFIFRVRANQEYAILTCLLVAILGLDRARRSWTGLPVVAAAVAAAFLIKGLFVVFVLMGAAIWLMTNPTRAGGRWSRGWVSLLAACALIGLVAAGYEALYRHATGEPFWLSYWRQQVAPVEIATPFGSLATLTRHALFYVSRLIWHPAPWTILALIAVARRGRRLADHWSHATPAVKRGLVFVLTFAAASIALLSPSGRVAERYVFYATYGLAAASAVLTCHAWPSWARALERLDARVPALPALTWFALVMLRLILGPAIPRI